MRQTLNRVIAAAALPATGPGAGECRGGAGGRARRGGKRWAAVPEPFPQDSAELYVPLLGFTQVRVAWEDPVLVLPRLDGIAVQDPPHRTPADGLAQRAPDPVRDIGQRLTAQRLLGLGHQLTGGGLDQGLLQGGKTRPYGRVRGRRPGRNRRRPSAGASGGPACPRGRLGAPPPPEAGAGCGAA